MRKSISKLIVAGISLAVSATSVYAEQFQKITSTNVLKPSVTSVAQRPNNDGRAISFAKTKAMDKQDSKLQSVSPVSSKPRMLGAAKAPARITGAEANLYGSVVYSNYEDFEPGLYSIPTNGQSEINDEVVLGSELSATGGGYYTDGKYFATDFMSFWGMVWVWHYVTDLENGGSEYVENDEISSIGLSCTYDYTSDLVYGCFYSEDGAGYVFGYQEVGTFQTVAIAELPMAIYGMGVSKDGTVYGIDPSGILYKFDKTSGAYTEVGNTSVPSSYLCSAAIDAKTDIMYYLPCNAYGSDLYTIDINTAEATYVTSFDYGEEICGAYIPVVGENDGLKPCAIDADSFTIANPGGEQGPVTTRLAEISFITPSYTADGHPLSDRVKYIVMRNNVEITSGYAWSGLKIDYLDVAPKSGSYTYTVYTENEYGRSPKIKNTIFVGTDTPTAPENVETTYSDGEFLVTWDAVDAGQFGGPLSGEVTYTVRGYKNGAQFYIENNIDGTSHTIEVAEPDRLAIYFFTVEANTPTASSEVGASTSTPLGHVNAPWEVNFDNASDIDLFTIIDANQDGISWSFNGEAVRVAWNSEEPMDDWLITPPIQVEADNLYTFYLSARGQSSYYVEKFEVAVGDAPTVEAMNNIIIDPVELPTDEYQVFKVKYYAAETGNVYFGIHGISDTDMYYLVIDNIGISAPSSAQAPAAVTDFKVTPAAGGVLTADITFNAPTTCINGNDLEAVDVQILRDGELIDTAKGLQPGAAYSYTDAVAEAGTYEYMAVPYNGAGAGLEAITSAFIGVNIPLAPASATVTRTENAGEVTITWEPVTQDITGNTLDPSQVFYGVYDSMYELVGVLEETTLTYQACAPEDQTFAYYMVYAATEAGVSETPAATDMIPVGTPYTMPFTESFNDGGLEHIIGVEGGAGGWQLIDNTHFEDLNDYDSTNGMLIYGGAAVNDASSAFTGMITLDKENPALSFAYYAINTADNNTLGVRVAPIDGEAVTVLEPIEMNEGEAEWIYKKIDLSQFAGQTIQIYFDVTTVTYVYSFIDQIRVASNLDYDLAAGGINAPALVESNENFNVTVAIANMGAKTAENYSVELYCNDEVVASKAGETVEPNQKVNVDFETSLNVLSAQENIYYAKVVFAEDLDESNNVSTYVAVYREALNAPMPENVIAVASEGGVSLTWDAPDAAKMPYVQTTDDFESYSPFDIENIGDYTLVDGDATPVGGVSGIQFGNIVPGETAVAYFVMNTVDAGVDANEAYTAHSGNQYLVSTFLYNGDYSDDWIITPELCGAQQTISFFAKSFSSDYPETFKVLYSTTDPVTSEFVEIATVASISNEWTKYSYVVPDGAKYFAIQCVSKDKFMLFVDDLTYAAKGAERIQLEVVGYNIYKNGVKINDAPVASTSYVDAEGSADDYYRITAVYAEGESDATAAVKAETATLDKLVAGKANVAVDARTIVVTGAEGDVNIYTADGKLVYSAAAEARNAVNVAPGVYVVKAGKLVDKVIVK